MIEARGLTKYYGKLAAIQDVSFDVVSGEVLGFLGPRAAGKTTMMRILAGYLPPSVGHVRVAGYDMYEDPLEARRHVGYLPENLPLYNEMCVRAYLDFMGALRGLRRRKQRIDEVMEMLQISHMANRTLGQLSRGQRQRVGLAQALIHNPEVLLLDEPTAGLEPAQIIDVRDLIREMGKEHAVVLSTRIPSDVEHTCQRVMILHAGRIVAEDSQEQLRQRLRGSEHIVLHVAGAPAERVVAELQNVPDVREVAFRGGNEYLVSCAPGADARAALAERILQLGWRLLELRCESRTAEDVFLEPDQDDRAGL
jgi:ABC-2 type transport system ATP-binding protein